MHSPGINFIDHDTCQIQAQTANNEHVQVQLLCVFIQCQDTCKYVVYHINIKVIMILYGSVSEPSWVPCLAVWQAVYFTDLWPQGLPGAAKDYLYMRYHFCSQFVINFQKRGGEGEHVHDSKNNTRSQGQCRILFVGIACWNYHFTKINVSTNYRGD